MYKVKEIYYTLQGEGFHSGRGAVFCRFSGCNLWSGREEDRVSAICKFCDTDFRGTDGPLGGSYHVDQLVETICHQFPKGTPCFVVFTGGEPALQLDQNLIDKLHEKGVEIAIETNGTLPLPKHIDWICVSPKAGEKLVITKGNELKLVFPQLENVPSNFEMLDFDHFYLQPLDDEHQSENINLCVKHCLAHPQWKLSLQTHKIIGIN